MHSYSKFIFWLMVLALSLASVGCSTYKGCWEENGRHRHFQVTMGNYNPEALTQEYCQTRCGLFEFDFAGMTDGKFCFCSNTLPSDPTVPDTNCNTPCAGNAAQMCGGRTYVRVYDSISPVRGLEITSDAITVEEVPVVVTVNTSAAEGASRAVYQVDFGDGSGFADATPVSKFTWTYYLPGMYRVHVGLSDVYGIMETELRSTVVQVEEGPADLDIQCDPLFGTHFEGKCEVTVWQGSNLRLEASIADKSVHTDIHPITDPRKEWTGLWSQSPIGTANDVDTAQSILLVGTAAEAVGKLYGLRTHVKRIGLVKFMVLTPKCTTNPYCLTSNTCTASCISKYSTVGKSCPVQKFCFQESTCDPACSAALSRYDDTDIPVDSYEAVHVISHNFGATGENFVTVNPPLDIMQGDILAIEEDGTVQGKISVVDTTDDDDITKPHQAAAVGVTFNVGGGSAYSARHVVQPLISYGSKVNVKTVLKYTLSGDTGVFPINITLVNNRGFGTPIQDSTNITLDEGIDYAIIDGPMYVITGEVVVFSAAPHTGSGNYNWTTSDGHAQSSTVDSLSYTFTTVGVYNVSLAIFNYLGKKENISEVVVQDKIDGLSITLDPKNANQASFINTTLVSGTIVNCTVDYGDSSPVFVYTPTDPSSLEFSLSHIYTSLGLYTVTVSCFNDVSSNSSSANIPIAEPISNLRLDTLGAATMQNFRLIWRLDSGSNVTFSFIFNGNPVTVDTGRSNSLAYIWESVLMSGLSPNGYPYELNATNDINSESISGTFIVLDPIVNPRITSDLNDVTTDDTVTFTIDMDGGSDVAIEVEFQDGLPNQTFTATPPGAPWTTPWVFTHKFGNGCRCRVTAYISNAAGSHVEEIEILVKVGFTSFSWDFPAQKYYLYNPPADIEYLVSHSGPLPTDPTFTMDWGDGSPIEVTNAITLSPDAYRWQYDDTEDYPVALTMANELSSKTFSHKAIVVEKLVGPKITLEFPSAPLNQPFDITFFLFRGDQGNLTVLNWDFGDGNPAIVTERKGMGEDGADTLPVTYNSLGSKTVTITATAPLGQRVSATETFNVIHGVNTAAVVVTNGGDSNFGTPTSFTVQYNSAQMPDTASIVIDWYGDGSVVSAIQPFSIATSGGTQTISYNYPTDGLHNSTVTISNGASRVVTQLQAGVYRPFTNLAAQISFIPDSAQPNPVPKLGLTGLQQLFPLDKPVYFEMSDDNNAFASDYDITSTTNPTDGAISDTFGSNKFNVNFTKEGTYQLQLVSRNPLHSASITKTIQMVKRVKNMNVTEELSQVSPGHRKNFNVSFEGYGADTCVYVDWGDLGAKTKYGNDVSLCTDPNFVGAEEGGDMIALTEYYVGYKYIKEGVYTVTMSASNAFGSEIVSIEFPISYKICSTPELSIHNQEVSIYFATEHKTSNIIRVLGLANINCPDSLQNTKKWKLEKVDDVTGDALPFPSVDVSGLELAKAELYIPARYLDLGMYKATYEMTMTAGTGGVDFTTAAFTYFKVMNSDLIGMMVEGGLTELTLGTTQSLTLEPLTWSLDPDLDPTASPQGLNVASWECEVLDTADQSTCAQIQTHSVPTQRIDGSFWTEGLRYQVTVNLYKGARQVMTKLIVLVNGTIARQVNIKCAQGSVCYQKSYGFQGIASSRMSIDCGCKDCGVGATFKWEIYIEDYRWPERWRPIREGHLVNKSITTDDETCGYSDPTCQTGIFSKALALQTELFDAYKHVANKYRARCEVSDRDIVTRVATTIIINQPPQDGNCTISPHVASATVTNAKQWEVYCFGWKDEDGIKDYQITSFFHEYESEKEVTSYPTSWSGMLTQVALPVGPKYRNYQQDVYVYVRDTQNAVTRLKIATVTVNPPDEKQIRSYVEKALEDDNHSFFKSLHEGDQRSVCELATVMASSMGYSAIENEDEFSAKCEVPSTWLNTGYGPSATTREAIFVDPPADVTLEEQYAYDSIRNNRANLRLKLTEFVLDMRKEDITSIQQVSGALSEITSRPTELSIDTQRAIIDGLDEMISSLGDPVKMKDVPQEDIQKAMSNIYATVGGIIDASGASGNFPTFTDMEVAKNDSSWRIYETSNIAFDDETDLRHTRSYEEAMKVHTLYIHKKLAVEKTSETAALMFAMMDKMADLFKGFSIPGQVQEATGYRAKYRLEKNFADNYLGETIRLEDSAASVTFPETLTDLFPAGNVDGKDAIILQVLQTTNTAKRSTENALKFFPKDAQTHFVSVDFYDKNGDRMSLPQTNEQIRIVIPNDSKAAKPEKKVVHPLVTDWNRFMFHATQIHSEDSNIHLNFEIEANVQLVVVARHNGVPDPRINATDFIFLVPDSGAEDEPSSHTLIVDKTQIDGRMGEWKFGVVERNGSFIDSPAPTNSELVERYKNGSGEFCSYNLTIFLSGCFYYRQGEEDWDKNGCVVDKETTFTETVCLCNHLTTFAGGLIVAPNTIDWNYVFSNMDFLSNPTLYVSEIVIFLLFVVGFVFARRKDIADVSKKGLAPLIDNSIDDKYLYEVVVSTGMWRNAGTESKVCFIMSGEDDETEPRILSDSKRDILKRGMTNGFLMAVPECLGRIQYIRIWHDNSGKGKFGSWFLNYIAVKDLQKDTKQVFILNRWLAVEEDDGLIDRIIPLAGKEQLTDFSYQFSERSKKNLMDDHLWFSLVARPPGSRFSCVERVACCLCLLFMTMMTNAMFYQRETSASASTSFDIGPFSLSIDQISIGFISTIIVFPANFLLVFLFRKSQSRNIMASKNQEERPRDLVTPSHVRLRPGSSTSASSAESDRPSTSASTAELTGKPKSDGHVQKKNSSCRLPWWCVIIAWILLIILTLGSAGLVTFYGITFKDEVCKQWITSLFVSFLTSIFITQPLKVILLAIFLALVIKNPDEEDDDEEEDEMVPVEDKNREFLHSEYLMDRGEMNHMIKEPPTTKQLEKIREQRVKEVKMWAVIREMIFYFLFLWILMVIAHRNRSSDNFHYKNSMYRTFIKSLDTAINFEKIKTETDFWLWAKTGLTGGLLAGSYYNDYPPLRLRTYINDKASRILGHAVLRQNRIKPNKCHLSEHFTDIIDECNILYEYGSEEKIDHDIGWVPLGTVPNGSMPEYVYRSADSLNGYPYWGYRGIYSGGGYVAHLNGSKETILELMNRLESEHWIDRYTRSVFIEFTVYNPQVNLFSMNSLIAEFDNTNGIVTSHRFEPAMLLPYMSGTMIFQLICEIVFLIYITIFLFGEAKNLYQQRLRYFLHFWNWIELCIIGLSIGAVVIYFYRLYETNRLTSEFKKSNGNEYIKFQFVAYWNEVFSYLIGFIVFFGTLKFLKLLRFNQRVSMLSNTIKYSRKSLLHFGIIALIVFSAFVQLFFLTYMNVDEKYSSFIESVVASILMMMGKFNIYVMIMAEPILTQVFVLAFVVAMTFIIVNMFISILNDAFSEVRGNLQNQTNEYEIIQFILQRFQKWLGIGNQSTGPNNRPPNGRDNFNENDEYFDDKANCPYSSEMQMFPDRIERLLQSLSQATTVNSAASGWDRMNVRPGEWAKKKPYSAPKSALEDFFPSQRSPRKREKRRISLARVDTE